MQPVAVAVIEVKKDTLPPGPCPSPRSSTSQRMSSPSWTNHSTRSLPWMMGRMYSSVVGQYRLYLQTDTTDGFHVTSERERY
jgi:hypothetical protein